MPPTPPSINSSVSNRKGNGAGGIKQALEEMTARFDTAKYY
jgi:hypothetical protein